MDGDQQSEAEPATDRPTAFPAMTTITAAVWLLFIPIAVLIGIVLWATEDRQQRARRWRRADGLSSGLPIGWAAAGPQLAGSWPDQPASAGWGEALSLRSGR